MKETIKYIEVFSLAYGGFAPMTVSSDYEDSLLQVRERLALIDSLNVGALLDEAMSDKGKAKLEQYLKLDASLKCRLSYVLDKKFVSGLQPDRYEDKGEKVINPNRLLRPFLDSAEKLLSNNVWSYEQYKEYRWTVCEIENRLEKRIEQFATAYDHCIKPKNQAKFADLINPTADKEDVLNRLHKAIDGRQGAHVGRVLTKAIDLKLLNNSPTKQQFISEFKLIGSWEAIRKYVILNLDANIPDEKELDKITSIDL